MSKLRINQYNNKDFVALAKKRLKKSLKSKASSAEINSVIKNWIQEKIIAETVKGYKVKIDKHSTIQVVGSPIIKDKLAMNLLSNGKYISRQGILKNADNMNKRRKDIKYKICYINKLAEGKNIHFKASAKFKDQVHKALINTNTHFHVNQ
jgi:hypothetical protein